MKESDIKVSVICFAYNHEKYIRQCLDGFVMQKTDFAFEVFVNDDCSTDHTADIIREYEERYPEIIHGIYQPVNRRSQGISALKQFVLPLVKGKYVAKCEGDDYWSDPLKLQKQFDAMERHPECTICTHRVALMNESGVLTGGHIPAAEIRENVLSSERVLQEMAKDYSFHTSSHFLRTDLFRAYWAADLDFRKKSDVGDGPTILYFADQGNMYYFPEEMSCYRVGSIGSWGSRTVGEKRKKHHQRMIASIESFDEYSHYRFTEILKDYIFRHELPILQYDCTYSKLLEPKYQKYFPNLPLKYRICAYLDKLFPAVFRHFLRKRRKGQS